jgi:hypothetical protein
LLTGQLTVRPKNATVLTLSRNDGNQGAGVVNASASAGFTTFLSQ